MTGQTIDQTYWIVASLSGFVYWAGYSDEYDRGQSYENSNGDLLFRNCKKGIKSKIPSSMLADDFSC